MNARMPDTKIRPPATMNIRLTELRVMPANEARKLRSTVLVSQLGDDHREYGGELVHRTEHRHHPAQVFARCRIQSSGATAVFSMAIGTA